MRALGEVGQPDDDDGERFVRAMPGSVELPCAITSGMTSVTRPANGPDRSTVIGLPSMSVPFTSTRCVHPALASATAWSVEEARIAPISVSSTTTKTTMLYMTRVAPVRKRRLVGYAIARRAVSAASPGRSSHLRSGHRTTVWFCVMSSTAENVTCTPSTM